MIRIDPMPVVGQKASIVPQSFTLSSTNSHGISLSGLPRGASRFFTGLQSHPLTNSHAFARSWASFLSWRPRSTAMRAKSSRRMLRLSPVTQKIAENLSCLVKTYSEASSAFLIPPAPQSANVLGFLAEWIDSSPISEGKISGSRLLSINRRISLRPKKGDFRVDDPIEKQGIDSLDFSSSKCTTSYDNCDE